MTNLLPLDMPAYLGVNIQPCRWEALGLFLTALKNNFPGSELLIITDFRVQNSLAVLHHLPADTIVQCRQFLELWHFFYVYKGFGGFLLFFFLLSVKGNITAMEQYSCCMLQWDWKREKKGRIDWLSWDLPANSLCILNKIASPRPAWNYIRMGKLKSVNASMLTTGEQTTANSSRPCNLGDIWCFGFKKLHLEVFFF